MKKIDEQKLHVKLLLRAADAPFLPVHPTWSDLKLEHYGNSAGILPLREFGTIESLFAWVNEGERFQRLNMPRKFAPYDVLAASLHTDDGVKVTAFICELPGSPFDDDDRRVVIVSGNIVCAKIPSDTKFVMDVAAEFFV